MIEKLQKLMASIFFEAGANMECERGVGFISAKIFKQA